MEAIYHFALVVVSQVILCSLAWRRYQVDSFKRVIAISALTGVLFGVMFDVSIGQIAGVFTYELGFLYSFLFFNGLLSYGLMIAHVWQLRHQQLGAFYLEIVFLALAYEVVNYLAPVWHWTFFAVSWQEYLFVVTFAYLGLALLMAAVLHYCWGVRFAMFSKVEKKDLQSW